MKQDEIIIKIEIKLNYYIKTIYILLYAIYIFYI